MIRLWASCRERVFGLCSTAYRAAREYRFISPSLSDRSEKTQPIVIIQYSSILSSRDFVRQDFSHSKNRLRGKMGYRLSFTWVR